MIKIFATGQIKSLDNYTIEHEPVRQVDLVERAATAFTETFLLRYTKQTRVVVLAGQGNNGADALAIARLLVEEHDFIHVETYLFNPATGRLSAACEHNKRRLMEISAARLTLVSGPFSPPVLGQHDVVIDGLFGSGLNRPLEGGFAAMVAYVNESEATVVSIDMPSGLFGEDNSGNVPKYIMRADETLTFGFPKLSFLLPENAPYVGRWTILDIGLHPNAIAKTPTPYHLVTEADPGKAILPRGKFAHKGDFGHALLVAGSRGKTGAALLAAKACLRSGAGLLTVHLPSCGETAMQSALPEAMLSIDADADCISALPDVSAFSAIGIGPGLGKHPKSADALKALLLQATCPLVVDADALNLIASNEELLDLLPPGSILTPHPKEFDRLAGSSANGYERLMKAQAFAARRSLIVVLKGAYTATCTVEGNVYFNSSGNPGMATAGSGDVLTGVILGLLASGRQPAEAAVCAVMLHGIAGDLAAATLSEESMIASDIIAFLGKAFKIQSDRSVPRIEFDVK
jgi:NAD(P)H-hydrate epimerase